MVNIWKTTTIFKPRNSSPPSRNLIKGSADGFRLAVWPLYLLELVALNRMSAVEEDSICLLFFSSRLRDDRLIPT